MRTAVLISGKGSNMQAMYREGIHIDLVVADRDCEGLKLAHSLALFTRHIDRKHWQEKEGANWRQVFTGALIQVLEDHNIGLVVMAGFMTILSGEMFQAFPNRVLNIHPSRLPLFPGAHAVRDTLAANPRPTLTGSTIHVAGPKVDDGRILFQTTVEVRPDDTEESLTARIKQVEHAIFPTAIREYMLHLAKTAR